MDEWEARLLSSAANGDVATVKKLLRKFINPNCVDPFDGHSALAKAAKGNYNIFKVPNTLIHFFKGKY